MDFSQSQGTEIQQVLYEKKSSSSSDDSIELKISEIHLESSRDINKKMNLEIEKKIIRYLKKLGIKFKTDPTLKRQKYFENPMPLQFISSIGDDFQQDLTSTTQSFNQTMSQNVSDFQILKNPFKNRKLTTSYNQNNLNPPQQVSGLSQQLYFIPKVSGGSITSSINNYTTQLLVDLEESEQTKAIMKTQDKKQNIISEALGLELQVSGEIKQEMKISQN